MSLSNNISAVSAGRHGNSPADMEGPDLQSASLIEEF